MLGTTDANQLWVNVSSFGDGNLFASYPLILARMMENAQDFTHGPPQFEILLPSNDVWRTKVYYQLVEKQRIIDSEAAEGAVQSISNTEISKTESWNTTVPNLLNKRPRICKASSKSSDISTVLRTAWPSVYWSVKDIVKAACILSSPSMPVEFKDEQEMRRVYSLIYDVFRYKNVLQQALVDTQFFVLFGEEKLQIHLVWLLLYDMYHRRFAERETVDGSASDVEQLFSTCNLNVAETALWATRIRLAAAMSRLRIESSALKLSDLLPPHLRDERVGKVTNFAEVSCWVNKGKIENTTPNEFITQVTKKLLLRIVPENAKQIGQEHVQWDALCPLFLLFHHSMREKLAQSEYISNNILILQNLSFSYGPAVFCKLLFKYNLTGIVLQTHIGSPRATAYLANLLTENDQIHKLYVFAAGKKKEEYEEYFKSLNIKNVRLFEEKFTDLQFNSDCLKQVAAVFATPPNSYSAINDPIDLVCSRGGDLDLLKSLTESAVSDEGQQHVKNILEEQRLTLRYAMSIPQIQYVLYETHSQLGAENEHMVKQVIAEVNRAAKYKHAEIQGKITSTKYEETESASIELAEINNNETFTSVFKNLEINTSDSSNTNSNSEINSNLSEDMLKDIELPETDEFHLQKIPDLCFNADQCLKLNKAGCYLGLLERKEITRFDAKYMIKMAESRGLFGESSSDAAKKPVKSTAKKSRKPATDDKFITAKRKKPSFEVERIAAPTLASSMRSAATSRNFHMCTSPITCPKHHNEEHRITESPAKLWWAETTRYLTRLRRSLLKQKLISRSPAMLRIATNEKITKDIRNIDEILGRIEATKTRKIPIFPKLRLTRDNPKILKTPFPVSVQNIELKREE